MQTKLDLKRFAEQTLTNKVGAWPNREEAGYHKDLIAAMLHNVASIHKDGKNLYLVEFLPGTTIERACSACYRLITYYPLAIVRMRFNGVEATFFNTGN